MRRLWGHWLEGPSRMRVNHLREWIQEHRAAESAYEAEAEAEGETPEIEGRDRETDEGMTDGWEEREPTK